MLLVSLLFQAVLGIGLALALGGSPSEARSKNVRFNSLGSLLLYEVLMR